MMGRKYRVALPLPKGHEYSTRLIEGIITSVQDRVGFEFIEVPYEENRTPAAIYHVEADGALVWTHHYSSWVLDLRDRGVKVVSLNSEFLADGIPCVGFDSDAILDAVVEHLAKLKWSHAAYIGHLTAINPAKLRQRDGFLQRANGKRWTTAAFEIPGIPSEERERLAAPAAESELIAFLQSLPKPVSIFCDDDYVGVLVCRVAEHLELSVPKDIAVLGVYDMAIARFSHPTLSSVPAPGQLVGAAGMKLLIELLNGAAPTENRVMIAPPPVVERESTGGTVVRDDDIRQAYRMIQEHACEGLTVAELIDRFAISQKTLNKRFSAVYGCTPGEAIRRIRLEQAKQWLGTTKLSIARIAAMCGFDEPSNFNLFFKREAGCTPSDYRSHQIQPHG